MNRRGLLAATICASSMPGGSRARDAVRLPAQLPVVQPTRFELVINLKTGHSDSVFRTRCC